mgnify:CR=1 FL=1
MNAQPLKEINIFPIDYLEFERSSNLRHEYFNGEIFAMTGSSLSHNRISSNIVHGIRSKVSDSACDVFSNDMRVKVDELEKYTYPDVVIVCSDIEIEKIKGMETLLNPVVIFEILSDSTEEYDRGDKFTHYRFIPSLREYILVSQKEFLVEKYLIDDKLMWNLTTYDNKEDILNIDSISCSLPLSEIYYRVEI